LKQAFRINFSLSNEVKDLTTKVLEVNQELSGKEATNANYVGGVLPASCGVASTQRSNLSVTFSSILSEEREKDKRELNLILHYIP